MTVTKYCEVFERIEKKYRLSARQYQMMQTSLERRMTLDTFGKTKITSLYFDTPDRLLIERSLDKPLYKEKMRLRHYGENDAEDACVFEEIKKKYKGVVYKRRVGLSLMAARAHISGMPYEQACAEYPLADPALAAESLSARSLQIAREIDSFRARYETLRPSMLIVCERSAYTSTSEADGELRITFDENLTFCDQLRKHAVLRPITKAGEVIMEIKNAGPMPLWLTHALGTCKAYPSSFSKYGEAYKACMQTQHAAALSAVAESFAGVDEVSASVVAGATDSVPVMSTPRAAAFAAPAAAAAATAPAAAVVADAAPAAVAAAAPVPINSVVGRHRPSKVSSPTFQLEEKIPTTSKERMIHYV